MNQDQLVCLNLEGQEIAQVVQGDNHVLALDYSGKVFALGDNSCYQVHGKQTAMAERKSYGNTQRSFSDLSGSVWLMAGTGYSPSPGHSMSPKHNPSHGFSPRMTEMTSDHSAYYEELVQVHFDSYGSKSILKVHAFGKSSMALDRSGSLYMWGEDPFTHPEQLRKIKFPQKMTEILGQKISKESRFE